MATLSGGNPTTAGQYTFTCSSNCALDKSAKYYVVAVASGGSTNNRYDWTKAARADNDETLSPANNGWLLGTGYYTQTNQGTTWFAEASVGRMKVAAAKNPYLTAGSFTDTTASLGLNGYTGAAWWHKRTAPSGSNACAKVAAGTVATTLTGLTEHDSHTYKAYDWPGCASGDEIASLTFVLTNDAMAASKITENTAKLTLTGHTGSWWLKQTKPPKSDAACEPRGSAATASLAGLAASTGYTFAAYDASGCADADRIASASFLTAGPLTVSNLKGGNDRSLPIGYPFGGPYKYSTAFRTGKHSLGYPLDSVKIQLSAPINDPDGGLTASIYTSNTTDTGDLKHGGNPNALVKNMGTKATPGTGEVTWTCDCDLQADTIYHVVLEAAGNLALGKYYIWTGTNSDAEAVTPASEGWRIANEPRRSKDAGGWAGFSSNVGRFELTVKEKAAAFIVASNVTTTTATLNVHHHTAAWWYKRTSPTGDATCHSVAAATASDSLTGLTPGVTYTYKAYTASGCNDASKEIGDETFAMDGESVSNLDQTAHNQSCYAGSGLGLGGTHRYECAMSFTTGTASGEYAMQKARVKIRSKTGSPGNIRVTLHADASGKPASTALATLSGSNPTAGGDYDFTCAGCYLTPNTTYWLVLAAPNAATTAFNHYTWNLTSSSNETPGPSGSGWTIANNYKLRGTSAGAQCLNDWCAPTGTARPAMFLVTATVNAVAPPRDVAVSDYQSATHPVTWKKPTTVSTDSYSYEVQCTTDKVPTSATTWNDCGTRTAAATANASLTLSIIQNPGGGNLQNMRVRAKQDGVYSRWIVAHTGYNRP